jgi:ATP-dependent helicase/nuclease subunit B
LKLSEQKKAEFDAASIGSFVHSILENVFKEIRKEKKSISELSDMEKYALTEKAAKKYLLELGESEVGSARFRITVERLCRAAIPVVDGLCDEFSKCSFTPTFFELKIGDKSAESPEATVFKTKDGSDVFVYGTIDRVDTLEKSGDVYVRVIDYKTGTKDFSPEDIKEGKNLQMFLYLKSITDTDNESFKEAIGVGDNGRILPAGVIYVKTSVKDEKIRHSSDEDAIAAAKHAQEREGMLLDDLEIIEAMNTDYIPVKFKDGVIDEKSKRYLYSSERWKNMMNELEEVVTGVADRIKSGEIRAITATSKKGDGCSYCEFKPICRIKEL